MIKKYKTAIIGLGNIGYDFQHFRVPFSTTHFEAYQKNSRVELAAVCDSDQKLVESIAKKNNLKGYVKSSELFKKENLDIVSICTPDDAHSSLAKEAAAAGVKGIWCEKPLADSLSEAREMVRLCSDKKIILAVNFVRRYDQFYQEIKNRLPELIGDVQTVTCYYSGGLVTAGSHLADLLNFLFGPAKTVTAEKISSGILARVHYNSGLIANLIPMRGTAYTVMELNIWGEKGRIDTINKPFGEREYRFFPLEISKYAPVSFIGRIERTPLSGILPPTYMEAGLDDLLKCVANGREPVSSGNTALQSLELISAIAYAGDHAGEKVSLPLSPDFLINLPPAGGDVRLWKKN